MFLHFYFHSYYVHLKGKKTISFEERNLNLHISVKDFSALKPSSLSARVEDA